MPPGAAADKAAAPAVMLATIPVPMVGVVSEVTLVAPPPPVMVEETRESKLPISPSGGTHGLTLSSEPKAPEGRATGTKLGCLAAFHVDEVVEIPSDDEANVVAESSVSLWELAVSPRELAASSRELAVV